MIKRIAIGIHLFVGVGALAGGLLGLSDPTLSGMGVDIDEMLKNAPFEDLFIPSLFLFVVLGLGNIIASVTGIKKFSYQGYISGFFGVTLVLWIMIQCYMLWAINILHVIFFIIGLIQMALALIIVIQDQLFPTRYLKIKK